MIWLMSSSCNFRFIHLNRNRGIFLYRRYAFSRRIFSISTNLPEGAAWFGINEITRFLLPEFLRSFPQVLQHFGADEFGRMPVAVYLRKPHVHFFGERLECFADPGLICIGHD